MVLVRVHLSENLVSWGIFIIFMYFILLGSLRCQLSEKLWFKTWKMLYRECYLSNVILPKLLPSKPINYYFLCVFVLHPLLLPYKGGRSGALNSACKTGQADFTDWMYFLPSSLMEEISHKLEAVVTNT